MFGQNGYVHWCGFLWNFFLLYDFFISISPLGHPPEPFVWTLKPALSSSRTTVSFHSPSFPTMPPTYLILPQIHPLCLGCESSSSYLYENYISANLSQGLSKLAISDQLEAIFRSNHCTIFRIFEFTQSPHPICYDSWLQDFSFIPFSACASQIKFQNILFPVFTIICMLWDRWGPGVGVEDILSNPIWNYYRCDIRFQSDCVPLISMFRR